VSETTQTDPSALPEPATDDRIIGATLILISEHGLGGVTMSQIADAAGVARQTLYNHFGDIESIVATTIEQHNRESIGLLEAALQIAESPTARIEQLVRHFASVGAHSDHALDLHGALAAELREGLDTYQNVVEAHIGKIIEDGQLNGDFRSDLSLAFDTGLIRALLDGVRDLAEHSPDKAAQIATAGTRTVLSALR